MAQHLFLYSTRLLAHALEKAHYLLVPSIAILLINEALQRTSMQTQDQGSLVLTKGFERRYVELQAHWCTYEMMMIIIGAERSCTCVNVYKNIADMTGSPMLYITI